MPGFTETLNAKPVTKRLIDGYLSEMSDTKREEAEALLRSRVAAKKVALAFTDEGFPVSENPVHDWRRIHGVR